jgi:hypothetical protein
VQVEHTSAALLACLAAALAPEDASAARWSGEVALSTFGDSARWVFSPELKAEFEASARWSALAQWGLVTETQTSEDGHGWTQVEPGNPALGAEWRSAASERWRWSVGAEAALPLARMSSAHDRHGRTAFGDAAALHGLWDLWLWSPDRLGLVVPASAALRGRGYRLTLEAAGALLAPVRDTLGKNLDALAQARFTAAADPQYPLELGASAQAALVATAEPNAILQPALGLYARWYLSRGDLALRLLVPLGPPLGEQNRWSLQLSFSLRGGDV